jgi:hypothetical protein
MRALLRIAPILVGLALAAPASAGDLTSVPPMLRGDVYAGYAGGIDLVEQQDRTDPSTGYVEVGRYARHLQGMEIGGLFSVYHGIAVRLSLPILFHDRLVWGNATDLLYDPDIDRPTAAGAPELGQAFLDASPSSRTRNGFGDLGIGFRIVPFAERGVPGRVAPASLAVDFDLLVPSGGNADKIRDNGTTGPGEGGVQVRLGLSASRQLGGAEPYLAVSYVHRAAYRVDLSGAQSVASTDVDDEGLTKLDPADEFTLRFGAEILALDEPETDASVRLDVSFRLTYRGPDQITSGTLVAAPLEPTLAHKARAGEHVVIGTGLGLRIRPRSEVELRVDFGGGWISPHLVERVDERAYGILTGPGSFELRWGMGALVRIR